MLDNRIGVRLILHLGQTLPLPPPKALLASLVRAEVTCDSSGVDGFQLTFLLNRASSFDPNSGGLLSALSRARIGVMAGAQPEMLIDGVITYHELSPGYGNGADTLTVTGRDLTVFLDLEERNAPYENQSDSVIVTQILSRYQQLGLVPKVSRTPDVESNVRRIPRQAETDLQFINRLAERNGYSFFLEPETFGVSSAYFGPAKNGNRLPAMKFNQGAADNVNALSATLDSLAPVDVEAIFLDARSPDRGLRSIPPSADEDEPLAQSALPSRRKVLHRTASAYTEGFVASTAAALKKNASDPVVLSGEVDIFRYGRVLRPRAPVTVAGAGGAYDGDHVVRKVTHVLTRTSYTQRFTLGREGTGSLRKVAI